MALDQETKTSQSEYIKKVKKLSDVEHVLLRPTNYVGSVIPEDNIDYVLSTENDTVDDEIEPYFKTGETLKYSRGLITLLNELLNNSYDEHVKTKSLPISKRLSKIDVELDVKKGCFKITDNGGIHVIKHPDYDNELIPTILFGSLKSGSNYDDEDRGKVGGTNGVGASLVNVFSTRFEVITNDTINTYHGVWGNNMRKMSFTNVTKDKKTKGFTTVCAYIEFKHFHCQGFDEDLINKLITRCAEVAVMGSDQKRPLEVNLKILRGDKELKDENHQFKFHSFEDYTKMFRIEHDNFSGYGGEDFDFIVGTSTTDSTESISILNSIRTDLGTHIDYLSTFIVTHIRNFMEKKHKIKLTPKQVKDRLRFFSKWAITKPSFSAQIKDRLTTDPKDFGFVIESNAKFNKWLETSEIVNRLLDFYENKSNEDDASNLRKLQSKKVKANQVDKHIDASSKDRKKCMIFITEGDSAQNGVRSCRDAEYQGAFCIGGKFVNAYGKKPVELMTVKTTNKKVPAKPSKAKMLMDATGLSFTKGIEELRYGKICIMTDADYDGYGIACQLIYFLRKFWKPLFDKGMVYRVISPIMVARKGEDVKVFYTMKDYEKEAKSLERAKYKVKHIKGLASLREEEYQDLINNPVLQKITCDDDDMKTMDVWFGDDVDIRKEYINTEFY